MRLLLLTLLVLLASCKIPQGYLMDQTFEVVVNYDYELNLFTMDACGKSSVDPCYGMFLKDSIVEDMVWEDVDFYIGGQQTSWKMNDAALFPERGGLVDLVNVWVSECDGELCALGIEYSNGKMESFLKINDRWRWYPNYPAVAGIEKYDNTYKPIYSH